VLKDLRQLNLLKWQKLGKISKILFNLLKMRFTDINKTKKIKITRKKKRKKKKITKKLQKKELEEKNSKNNRRKLLKFKRKSFLEEK